MNNICDMIGIPEQHRRTVAYESQFADGWRDPACSKAPIRWLG